MHSLYEILTSSRGRKVTSVGVLYDFTGNDKNTTVQKVEDMVKEQWFHEAIEEEPDFFLLVGSVSVSSGADSQLTDWTLNYRHMPVQRDNCKFDLGMEYTF